MVKVIIVFLFSVLILPVSAKETKTNMRAGLWEITTSSDLLLLAQHIPKNQLSGIAAIAKEYGLEMPALDNGSAISQACVTQDMAEQQILPSFHQKELNCTTSNTSRQGSQYQVNFSCNSAMLKGEGSAKGNITNAVSFTGTSHFKGSAQGVPVNEEATINGKWIIGNCGNVKPL